METYVILRRAGWRTAEDLQEAAARSTAEGEKMPDEVRWIRSYILEEPIGGVGTVCIYQASSPEAIREDADAADAAAPSLFGQPFLLTPAPNRFGIPSFYALHSWIWKPNPSGSFQP